MQRRVFMKNGALALVTMGLSPTLLRRTIFAQELAGGAATLGNARGKVLICLFQRGAADALNVIVPHGEQAYYRLRPTIAVTRPTLATPDSAIDLDGFFGLHPALAPLKPLWTQGILAPVQAVGSPSSTRSHFDAQDYMESGTPDNKGTKDGWLNRYLAAKGTCAECETSADGRRPTGDGLFRAVSMTQQTPRILMGPAASVAMNSIEEFAVRASGPAASNIESMYGTGRADVVHAAGGEMIEAMKALRAANPTQ